MLGGRGCLHEPGREVLSETDGLCVRGFTGAPGEVQHRAARQHNILSPYLLNPACTLGLTLLTPTSRGPKSFLNLDEAPVIGHSKILGGGVRGHG